jgi:hypothetical protein
MFVVLLDERGRTRWSRAFGGLGDPRAPLVAVDPKGDVVIAGGFSGPAIDLGLGPLQRAGAEDVFVAKLDASGSTQWSKRFGGPDIQFAAGLAVDPAGRIVLAGAFVDSGPDFGLGPLPCAGGSDIFVVELDPGGDPIWSRSFGGPGTDSASAAGVDGEGNVVVAGMYTTTIDFGSGALHGDGLHDLFVAELDRNGGAAWSRSFAGEERHDVSALTVSPAGHVAFTGWSPEPSGFVGNYLTVLDPAGRTLWARRSRSASLDPPVLDGAGNLFVASSPRPTGQLALRAYSMTGEPLWSGQLGGGVSAHLDAAIDRRTSAIVVVGRAIEDPIDVGTGPLPAADGQLFVVSLAR